MATDLKSVWFEAITSCNVSVLSRLLYATPNPLTGQQRLEWTNPDGLKSVALAIKLYADSKGPNDKVKYMNIAKSLIAATPKNHVSLSDGQAISAVKACGNAELVKLINAKTSASFESAVASQDNSLEEGIHADKQVEKPVEDFPQAQSQPLKTSEPFTRTPKVDAPPLVVLKQAPEFYQKVIETAFKSNDQCKLQQGCLVTNSPFKKSQLSSQNVAPADVVCVQKQIQDLIIKEVLQPQVQMVSIEEPQQTEVTVEQQVKEELYIQPDQVDIVSITRSANNYAFEQDVKAADYYSTVYLKNAKPVILLVDPDRDNDSPTKVKFGQSWKGNLEQTRTFRSSASVSAGSVKRSSRPALRDMFNLEPAVSGKLVLNLVSMRGLVVNFFKVPDHSYLYCIIRVQGQEPIYTHSVMASNQSFGSIPINEEFGFNIDKNAIVQVELMLHAEYKKKKSFDPRTMLKQKNSPSQQGDVKIQDQLICKLDIVVGEVYSKCSSEILDRKWSWNVIQSDADETARPVSRAASIVSVGSDLMRSLSRRMTMKTATLSQSLMQRNLKQQPLYEVQEAGNIQIQMVYVPDVTDEDGVPDTVQGALDWQNISKWYQTLWIEGHLSQQGGDVKFWRRRYFKVIGASMEAYHEFSMDYRTTIDLSQLIEVVNLPQSESESYTIKNSFRLVFKHGETIDFYANSEEDYLKWTESLLKIQKNLPVEVEEVVTEPKHVAVGFDVQKQTSKAKQQKRISTGFVKKPPSLKKQQERNISPEKVASSSIALFGFQS